MTASTKRTAPHRVKLLRLLLATCVPLALMPAVAKADDGEITRKLDVTPNTEIGASAAPVGPAGFSISVDGQHIAGDHINTAPQDEQRTTDLDLESVDIQVKFDGLGVKPTLNVATTDLRHSYGAGEEISFRTSSNYGNWIDRAELRVFEADATGRLVDTIAVAPERGAATWVMPEDGAKRYTYVLRVFDKQGRYDETVPLGIRRSGDDFARHETNLPLEDGANPVAAGEAEDRTALRNIPVYGGAVTVFGRNVPKGSDVQALGGHVPVDADGAFVVQRILPPGDHVVDVQVAGDHHGNVEFERDINIPDNEWFYVGLADLTVGKRFGSDAINNVVPGEYDDVYTKGRAAFYVKGKIKGKYILTAAADTREDDLDQVFRNLDGKDPRQLLRRIDPDKFYPVYGDDSTAVEDAPTAGKFYVRLERGDSHVMWGNYKTTIKGTEFARNERAMYGAHGVYRSENTTIHGERKIEVEAYASQPDTLPQRDLLRGTGGSVYFLTRQDVNRGSETVTIEVRDDVTGIVRERRVLRYGQDYEINYLQGVIILKQPLASSAGSSTIVSSGTLAGNRNVLAVSYEYTPVSGDVDGYSYGGRAQGWVGDNVRVGVTGMSENSGTADQEVIAADVHVRLAENSWVEAEIAQSSGPGFGQSVSLNGGLTINSTGTSGVNDRTANAYRARMLIDLADFDPTYEGILGAYYEKREAGFSSLGYNTSVDQRVFGVEAKFKIENGYMGLLKYEDFKDGAGRARREGDAQLDVTLNEDWSVGFGAKYTHLANPTPGLLDGGRADVGAKITRTFDENNEVYVFGQGTVQRSGNLKRNDRIGAGFKTRVSEKLGVEGEVSYGTLGWGALVGVTYDKTPDDHYYIRYTLDPNRAYEGTTTLLGRDAGSIVVGARHKYNDFVSVYIENNYDRFGARQSLTSTYGVNYTPTAAWTWNAGLEYGEVNDTTGDLSTGVDPSLDRVAASLSVAYKDEAGVSWNVKGEARFEDSATASLDRDTYLLSGGVSIKVSEDWRALGNVNVAISNSNQSTFLDGDFIEASIGAAYRPIDNDRFNGLFKYTYLYDLPGPDQVNSAGNNLGPAQRSHIMNVDGSYDVNEYLTIGAKYGFRIGEVSQTRAADDFVKSSAHLGVLRADIHVVKKWDVFAEARILHTPEIDTTNTGAVIGVYRHMNDNLKVGVGYNFGKFSDNVADLTQDDSGVFLNVIGKF